MNNGFISLRRWLLSLGVVLLVMTQTYAIAASSLPRVRLQTTLGAIIIELEPTRAPLTVANFLEYVRAGHYNGTVFHRAIPGFVVQGGGYTATEVEKPTTTPVFNESGNGFSNRYGTVALARTDNPHSGTAQFYINLADNLSLDPQPARWGYAVFGRVVQGMDVAQKISDTPTGASGSFKDAPLKPIVIEKAEVLN